jgi:hypothetical protein
MVTDNPQDSNQQAAQAAFDGVPIATEAQSATPPAVDTTTTATPPAEVKQVSAKPAVKSEWEIERERLVAEHAKALETVQRNAAAANGKYGATKQKLDKLLAEQAALESEASKKTSAARAATWAEFSENFPEFAGPMEARHAELEAKIQQLESQLGSKAQPSNNADEPPVDGTPDIEGQIAQKISVELFARLHPDAKKHAWSVNENGVSVQKYSPEFQQWLGTLPEAEQRETAESWDAAFVSRQFTKFENWNSARTSGAVKQKAASQQRVQSAVLPSASKAPVSTALTAQQAFDAA